MKVKFNSHMEIAALQNTFLFAEHSVAKINRLRELDPFRAEECERENEVWVKAQNDIRDAQPGVEYEINLMI